MRPPSTTALTLLAAAGCAAPAEDAGRGPGGKADDGTASAGSPLVTCRLDDDAVTCGLEPTRAPLRISRVLVGPEFALRELENEDGACTTAREDCPEVTFGSTLERGSDITANITFEGLESASYANLVATLPYPDRSSPSTAELPYDLWSVRFTRLDDAEVNYLFRYPLSGDGVVRFLGGADEIEHFGGVKLEGEEVSEEIHLPVTPDSEGPQGLLADITVTGEPHFSLAQPGCYVVAQGGPPRFDAACAETSELVDLDEEDPEEGGGEGEECACDVEAGCDAGCECDAACPASDTICVSGTEFECDDEGETWNEDEETCCVEAVATCEPGTEFECDDEGETWTGEICCLQDVAQCVAGTEFECDDEGERWTGETCCLLTDASCQEGSEFSCEGTWTGELCCE